MKRVIALLSVFLCWPIMAHAAPFSSDDARDLLAAVAGYGGLFLIAVFMVAGLTRDKNRDDRSCDCHQHSTEN